MSGFQNHYLPLILAIILAGVSTWYHNLTGKQLVFKTAVTLAPTSVLPEDSPLVFQLFYDIGDGYTEDDSTSFLFEPEKTTTLSQTIACCKVHGLRLDIMNVPGSAIIEEAGVYDITGKRLFDLLDAVPSASNQIAAFNEINKEKWRVQTEEGAVDPFIVFTFSPPLKAQQKGDLGFELLFGLKIFFMLFIGMWIMLWVVRFSEPKDGPGSKK